MGLFDILKSQPEQTEVNNRGISKVTSEKATELIKELSGGKVQFSKKLVDNIVVITNASGGAGASTITSNVAFLAATKGLRVLVVDLNILFPIQHLYFGIQQEIERTDLVGYLLGRNSLGDAIVADNGGSVMFANNRSLMDVINCESDQSIQNFNTALEKLRHLYDLVLIDTPMRIENTLCNMAFFGCDQIYIVWDEGIGSIANTEKIRRNMAMSGIDTYTKMKVVLNKRTNIQYNQYPFKKLNIELAQVLPFEPDIIYSSLRSEIFCDKGASSSKNAKTFYAGMDGLTDRIMAVGGYVK